MSDTDLSETIANVAARPAEVATDGFSTRRQPLPDLIAADRHLARKTAAAATGLPFRVLKGVPPGAV